MTFGNNSPALRFWLSIPAFYGPGTRGLGLPMVVPGHGAAGA